MIYYQEHILSNLFESKGTDGFKDKFTKLINNGTIAKRLGLVDNEDIKEISFDELNEIWGTKTISEFGNNTLQIVAKNMYHIFSIINNINLQTDEKYKRCKEVLQELKVNNYIETTNAIKAMLFDIIKDEKEETQKLFNPRIDKFKIDAFYNAAGSETASIADICNKCFIKIDNNKPYINNIMATFIYRIIMYKDDFINAILG